MLKETAVPSLFCMPTQILDIIFNEQFFVLFPFAFQSGFPTGLGHIGFPLCMWALRAAC